MEEANVQKAKPPRSSAARCKRCRVSSGLALQPRFDFEPRVWLGWSLSGRGRRSNSNSNSMLTQPIVARRHPGNVNGRRVAPSMHLSGFIRHLDPPVRPVEGSQGGLGGFRRGRGVGWGRGMELCRGARSPQGVCAAHELLLTVAQRRL